jgi:hypothetical protein
MNCNCTIRGANPDTLARDHAVKPSHWGAAFLVIVALAGAVGARA